MSPTRGTGRFTRWTLRLIAIGYLLGLVGLPLGYVFYRTFRHGIGPVWTALQQPDAVHALKLTLQIAAIAVPLNVAFGVLCALWLVRGRGPGKWLVGALVDLPLALSPVVVGLAFILIYGRQGWFGGWLMNHGYSVIFAVPGMVLATVFVSLPFVVREVVPLLREVGTDQEQAAWTLGSQPLSTFVRITLPAIWPAVAYGLVLTTARAIGEFGAVSVVSGHIEGQTQTLPLYVEDEFGNFDVIGAYSASIVLALIAILTLVILNWRKPHHVNPGRIV
jgi:sulfate transport system permease protein